MAYIQSYNSQRKKDDNDPYGGFSTTNNAGVNDTSSIATDTGLLKDTTAGGKLENAQSSGSGRFVNLQNYLDANKPQAVDLSAGVGQHIGSEVGQANTALDTAKTTYKADVDKNTRSYDERTIADVLSNPNANANAAGVKKFQEMASGSYAGPTLGSTGTFDSAIQETAEARQAGENVKTAGGQTALLKGMSKERPYSTGGYNFNQLLLQNNEQARANITEAGKMADPLAGNLTNAFTTAANQTVDAQITNQQVADQARAAVAAETARQEQEWAERARAIDAEKSVRSEELLNKLSLADIQTRSSNPDDQVAALKERKYLYEELNKMAKNTNQAVPKIKQSTLSKMFGGNATTKARNAYRSELEGAARAIEPTVSSGTVMGAGQGDTAEFSDQDLHDMGMTRMQMSNMLRSRQRVVDMGGNVTDLSQWMRPYLATTSAAGAATSEEANRYSQLNSLIGQAPTQNVSQAALDAARQDRPIFDAKEAYVRMNTEVSTLQAQQQLKWAKEQELAGARAIASAQEAAAKAAKRASMISTAVSIVAMALSIAISDENLKENITETSGDDISRILDDLTKGNK